MFKAVSHCSESTVYIELAYRRSPSPLLTGVSLTVSVMGVAANIVGQKLQMGDM